jgi:hypothetical protein
MLGAISLAGFCSLPGLAIASEMACQQSAQFELRVIPVHGDVKYDFTKSILEIQREAGPVIAAKHHPLLGMAVQGFGIVSVVQTGVLPREDGLHCPILNGIELRIGWVERTIFIASEVTGVDCLYTEAVEHQLRHVRIEDEALKEFIPGFTQLSRIALANLSPQPQPDAMLAKAKLVQSIDLLTANLMAPLEQGRAWRREIVESAEELDRIRTACGDIEERLREMGKPL